VRGVVALLAVVLSAMWATTAAVRKRAIVTCYDGQAGAVTSYLGVPSVVGYPLCDADFGADGVCTFSFP